MFLPWIGISPHLQNIYSYPLSLLDCCLEFPAERKAIGVVLSVFRL